MAEWHQAMLAEHVPELAKDVTRGILEVEKILISKGLDPGPLRQELSAYLDRQVRQLTLGHGLPGGRRLEGSERVD
jgi:hypothetical protein